MIVCIQQNIGSGVMRTVASWAFPEKVLAESVQVSFVGLATPDTTKVARYELILIPDPDGNAS